MKGFDTFSPVTAAAAGQLAALGYAFAGRYYRRLAADKSGLTKAEVATLHAHGLGVLAVFEHKSDHVGYFTPENGRIDGQAAIMRAYECGQPKSTAIYGAIDTDITAATLGAVKAYWEPFARIVKNAGYGLGLYGDGDVLATMTAWYIEGWGDAADHAWLANAKAWTREKDFSERHPDAWDVKQGLPVTLPFGLQIDPDEAKGAVEAGLWMPPSAEAGA